MGPRPAMIDVARELKAISETKDTSSSSSSRDSSRTAVNSSGGWLRDR
jgi:hypothetical protein